MPRSVVLLTQLFDRDEISSCVGSIVEKRNVWMIKPFLQKPNRNMSQTVAISDRLSSNSEFVHTESTHLIGFFRSEQIVFCNCNIRSIVK